MVVLVCPERKVIDEAAWGPKLPEVELSRDDFNITQGESSTSTHTHHGLFPLPYWAPGL